MAKMFLATILGTAFYLSLSFYQPVVEAQTLKEAEANRYSSFSFISPIPYEMVVVHH